MEIVVVIVIALVVGAWLFGGGKCQIGYELNQVDAQDAHREATGGDFNSYGELKRTMHDLLKNYQCPVCGGQKVTGSGVIVTYGKVHLYRQVASKGWFGGTKYRDEFVKTVWRVHDMSLRNAPGRALLNLFGAFDDPPGELTCTSRGCAWKTTGERGGALSLGDLLQGRFN